MTSSHEPPKKQEQPVPSWQRALVEESRLASLVLLFVLAALIALLLLLWRGFFDWATDLNPGSVIYPETLSSASPIASGGSIDENTTLHTEIDAFLARRELDITQTTSERLVAAVYFSIAAVLGVSIVVAAFGWFSAYRLSAAQVSILREEIKLATEAALVDVSKIRSELLDNSNSNALRLVLADLRTSIRGGDPDQYLVHARSCCEALMEVSVGPSFELRIDFGRQLDVMLSHFKDLVDENEVLAAAYYLEKANALIISLDTVGSKQHDSGLLINAERLRAIIEGLDEVDLMDPN